MNKVPKKVNRHVVKAIQTLHGDNARGPTTFIKIMEEVQSEMRNLIPVPNVENVIRNSLLLLLRYGVLERVGYQNYAVRQEAMLPGKSDRSEVATDNSIFGEEDSIQQSSGLPPPLSKECKQKLGQFKKRYNTGTGSHHNGFPPYGSSDTFVEDNVQQLWVYENYYMGKSDSYYTDRIGCFEQTTSTDTPFSQGVKKWKRVCMTNCKCKCHRVIFDIQQEIVNNLFGLRYNINPSCIVLTTEICTQRLECIQCAVGSVSNGLIAEKPN